MTDQVVVEDVADGEMPHASVRIGPEASMSQPTTNLGYVWGPKGMTIDAARETLRRALTSADALRSALAALAVDDPDTIVYGDIGCFWCHGVSGDHTGDCPWVAARRLLGKETL